MKKLLLITILLILTGCGGQGTHFEFDNAKLVKVGDTEKQLVDKMKMPPLQIATGSSPDIWVWTWAYVTGLSGETGQVSFPLINGKVSKLPIFPDDYLQEGEESEFSSTVGKKHD
jgi:hypothetical protein